MGITVKFNYIFKTASISRNFKKVTLSSEEIDDHIRPHIWLQTEG